MARDGPGVLAPTSGKTPRARKEDSGEGQALPGAREAAPHGHRGVLGRGPEDPMGALWVGGWSPREAGPRIHTSGSGRLSCAPQLLFASGGPDPCPPPHSALSLVPSLPSPPAGRLVDRWGLRRFKVANLSSRPCHHGEKRRFCDVLKAGLSAAAQVTFRAGQLVTAGLSHAVSPGLHPLSTGGTRSPSRDHQNASRHCQTVPGERNRP